MCESLLLFSAGGFKEVGQNIESFYLDFAQFWKELIDLSQVLNASGGICDYHVCQTGLWIVAGQVNLYIPVYARVAESVHIVGYRKYGQKGIRRGGFGVAFVVVVLYDKQYLFMEILRYVIFSKEPAAYVSAFAAMSFTCVYGHSCIVGHAGNEKLFLESRCKAKSFSLQLFQYCPGVSPDTPVVVKVVGGQ